MVEIEDIEDIETESTVEENLIPSPTSVSLNRGLDSLVDPSTKILSSSSNGGFGGELDSYNFRISPLNASDIG